MKIVTAFLVITLSVVAPFAMAGGMRPVRSYNTLADIPYSYLGTLVSSRPTTLNDFVLGISPYLHGYAEKTNTESCGEIAKNKSGVYALIWGTNHSHLACVIPEANVPNGFTAIGMTIHAHPVRRGFRMTKADVVLGGFGCLGRWVGLFVDTPNHFSQDDYAGGPGYLAIPDGAIRQNGSASTVEAVIGVPAQIIVEQRASHYLAAL